MEYKFNSREDCRRLHLNEFRYKHCDAVLAYLNATRPQLEYYKLINHDSDIITNIAKYNKTSRDNITLTIGSDDALRILIGNEIVCTIGSYYGYIDNISTKVVKYEDCKDYESHILYIASPNNPDGVVYTHEQIKKYCAQFKMVIVDEAYIEFMGVENTAASLKIDNLFITRTFSKAFGLASVRVGYIISNGLGRELQYKINPKNFSPLVGIVNVLLDNVEYYEQCARDLRHHAAEFFDKIKGKFTIIGGVYTNFYMIKLPENAAQIFEDNGILVRKRGENFVRITLGTKEDNDAVLEILVNNI